MNKLTAIITGLIFYSCTAFSQGTFSAVYNGGSFKGMTMSNDNNCILFAKNGSATIAKADTATGNFYWSAQINFPGQYFHIHTIVQATDGNYIALIGQIGAPTYTIAALKVSSAGTLIWVKKYFATSSNAAWDLCSTPDDGFIMVGGGCAGSNFVVRCDSWGNIIWQKQYKDPSVIGGSAFEISDAGNDNYYISGMNTSLNNDQNEILFKINSAGDLLWFRKIIMSGQSFNFGLVSTNDGGATLTGITHALDSTIGYTYLAHFDSVGNNLWLKVYADNEGGNYGNDLIQLQNGNYITTGHVFYNDIRNVQMMNFGADNIGNILWAKSGGRNQNGAGYDDSFSMSPLSDATFLAGGTNIFSKLSTDGNGWCFAENLTLQPVIPTFTIETPASVNIYQLNFITDTITYTYNLNTASAPFNICTNITGVAQINESENEIIVSPNPFVNTLNISTTSTNDFQLVLYNIHAGKILEKEFTGSLQLNTDQLSPGVYFYEIRDKKGLCKRGKVVKD